MRRYLQHISFLALTVMALFLLSANAASGMTKTIDLAVNRTDNNTLYSSGNLSADLSESYTPGITHPTLSGGGFSQYSGYTDLAVDSATGNAYFVTNGDAGGGQSRFILKYNTNTQLWATVFSQPDPSWGSPFGASFYNGDIYGGFLDSLSGSLSIYKNNSLFYTISGASESGAISGTYCGGNYYTVQVSNGNAKMWKGSSVIWASSLPDASGGVYIQITCDRKNEKMYAVSNALSGTGVGKIFEVTSYSSNPGFSYIMDGGVSSYGGQFAVYNAIAYVGMGQLTKYDLNAKSVLGSTISVSGMRGVAIDPSNPNKFYNAGWYQIDTHINNTAGIATYSAPVSSAAIPLSITGMSITATLNGGSVKVALSSDGGTTWKAWNGTSWATITDISNNGMAYNATWGTAFTASSAANFKMAVALSGNTSPTVSGISLSYNATPPLSVTGAPQSISANVQNISMTSPSTTWTINSQDVDTYSPALTATLNGNALAVANGGNSSNRTGTINYTFTNVGTYTLATQAQYNSETNSKSTQNIAVNVSADPPSISSASCSGTVYQGQAADCTVSASAPWGTLQYTWTVSPDGSITTNNASSTPITWTTTGSKTVTIKVALAEDPTKYVTQTITVNVQSSAPTVTLTCPSSQYQGETANCTVSASTPWTGATILYDWSPTPSGCSMNTVDGTTESLQCSTTGSKTVTVKAYLQGAPTVSTTQTKTVTILDSTPTVNVTCPATTYQGKTETCSATATSPWSGAIIQYSWAVGPNGTLSNPSANTLSPNTSDVMWTATGAKTVTATASIQQMPSITNNGTANVTVQSSAPTVSVSCPASLYQGQSGGCTATASTPWTGATINYTWNIDSGTATNDLSAQTTINSVSIGNRTVTVRAYLAGNSSIYTDTTATVNILDSTPTVNVSCPASLHITETGDCTATASVPYGTLNLTWTTSDNNATLTPAVDGLSATVAFPNPGNKTVTITAERADNANIKKQASAAISVTNVTLTLGNISCVGDMNPNTTYYQNRNVTCSVTATSDYGTPSISITSPSSATNTPNGAGSVILTFTAAGLKDINAVASLVEIPTITTNKKLQISITGSSPVVNSITCPASIEKGVDAQCSADVTVPWGTPQYQWQFFGGTASGNTATATINGTKVGTFVVRLKVSIAESPTVYGDNTVNVAVTGVTAPSLVVNAPKTLIRGNDATFTATASSPYGTVAVSWTIDGQSYMGNSVTLHFTDPKSVSITTTAQIVGYEGKPDSSTTINNTLNITTMPKPNISITTPYSIISGQTGAIKVATYALYSPVITTCTLPDNTTTSQSEFNYTFGSDGQATFTCTANVQGYSLPEETATATKTVTVKPYTFPGFKIHMYGSSSGYWPFFNYFAAEASTVVPSGATFKYDWDFGDGETYSSTSSRIATHTFKSAGNFTIQLTVTDMYGATKTDSVQVTVSDASPIEVGFKVTATNQYDRVPVTAVVRPVITGGNPQVDRVASYAWTVNGQPVKGTSFMTFEASYPGEYAVQLTVTMNTGRTGTGSFTYIAKENQLPTCDFIATDYPTYKYTKLTTQDCKDPDGRIVSYQWDLGDGSTSTAQTVYAKYKESGIYTVILTVTDNSGGAISVSKDISVSR